MRIIFCYMVLTIVILTLIPLFIVKGCSYVSEEIKHIDEVDKVDKVDKVDNNEENIIVRVFIHKENKIVEMPIEEYIKGVTAAEMPVEFEVEALKAQAVAARTYVYGRMQGMYKSEKDVHKDADVCTDSTHCQAWIRKEDMINKWSSDTRLMNWDKIDKAVKETRGLVIIYDDTIINPLFHSNSGGQTENVEDVWEVGDVPYLKSVMSQGEDVAACFSNSISINENKFINKLKSEYPNIKVKKQNLLKNITIVEASKSGRVKKIKIGNVLLKGSELRKLFNLNSTNIKIEEVDYNKTVKITTRGNGHGVGMSQWGANFKAQNGDDFQKILKYYYNGVDIKTIWELTRK